MVSIKNLSLKKKLFLGFNLLTVLVLLIGFFGVRGINSVTDSCKRAIMAVEEVNFLSEKLGDHYVWMQGLTDHLLLDKELKVQLDPHQCGFGKWYYEVKEGNRYKNMSPDEKKLFDDLESPHIALHESGKKIKDLGDNGGAHNDELALYQNESVTAVNKMVPLFKAYKDHITKKKDDASAAAAQTKKMTINTSIGVIIFCALFAMVFGFVITKTITSPFAKILEVVKRVAEGDFTKKVDHKGKDELGVLAESFNQAIDNIGATVGRVSNTAQTISATAQQLAASSQQVNAATQQVSSGVQEVASGSQNLAQETSEVSSNAKALTEEATKGSEAAKVAGEKMQALASAVNQSAQSVTALGDKSQEIVQIIETINNINAAIEAARAGEAGRGFAVVADEVRKLAEESQQATQGIESLITEIKSSTDSAVKSMESGKKEVEEGGQVVSQALQSLDSIGSQIITITSSIPNK
ncbi:MAG: Methyl-accepting chemotaxis sensory transducer [candidate division CPR2 bacterium GW2011_GWC2_39_35]|nr:MAG: Methyl-accepting chemotaxis sensory transducer [candidate division CPR2 bacterium GW2011_GWC2_39_35]